MFLAAVFTAVAMQAAPILVSEQGAINFYTSSSELSSNNIQFNDFANPPGSGLLAKTNDNVTTLSLTSNESIQEAGSGQASVEATDGGFLALNLAPVSSASYLSAIFFNVDLVQRGNNTYPDALTVNVNYANLIGAPNGIGTATYTLHTQGLDGIFITVDGGFGITNVSLQSTQALQAVKQIRVLGGTFELPNDPSEVPEPATMSMLGMGLFGLVYWRRRRS